MKTKKLLFIFSFAFLTSNLFCAESTGFLSSGNFLPSQTSFPEGTAPIAPTATPSNMPPTRLPHPEMDESRKAEMNQMRQGEQKWRQDVLDALKNCENYLKTLSGTGTI